MRENPVRAVGLAVVCLLLLGVTVWSFRSSSAAPPEVPFSGAEMDSLSRYLEPSTPAPRLDDYAVFLPAARPDDGYVPPPPPEAAPDPNWELSAILIAGSRPVAIINDQTVAPGARFDDGTVVLEIQRDHVVLQSPNGARRRLTLTAG